MDTTSDVIHCGGCEPCPEFGRAEADCTGSSCVYECDSGALPFACHTASAPACAGWDWQSGAGEGWRRSEYYGTNVASGDFQVVDNHLSQEFLFGDFGAEFDGVGFLGDLCSNASETSLTNRTLTVRYELISDDVDEAELVIEALDGGGAVTIVGSSGLLDLTAGEPTMRTLTEVITTNLESRWLRLNAVFFDQGSGEIRVHEVIFD